MMKRVTWFVGGVAVGLAGAGYAKKKVVETASQLTPSTVAKSAADRMAMKGREVAEALREGRRVMRQHEEEVEAIREGRLVLLEDHVAPDDEVYVDGELVQSERVIVMRPR
jgi:hypothetical protein